MKGKVTEFQYKITGLTGLIFMNNLSMATDETQLLFVQKSTGNN